MISIHAPTRGATSFSVLHDPNMIISIHAPTRGATSPYHCNKAHSLLFQSTLPREERLCVLLYCFNYSRFQSTLPREERQLVCNSSFSPVSISIHAPTRGATAPKPRRFGSIIISIHAPTRGATRCLPHSSFSYKDFNPRSHERSDNIRCHARKFQMHFNPRSHERSDSNIAQKICLFLYNTDNKYIIR